MYDLYFAGFALFVAGLIALVIGSWPAVSERNKEIARQRDQIAELKAEKQILQVELRDCQESHLDKILNDAGLLRTTGQALPGPARFQNFVLEEPIVILHGEELAWNLTVQPISDETWNRHTRAADQERKARLEGRLPTKADQEELNQEARR